MEQEVPIHQWTNGGEYVLFLKCVNSDMTSYGGFVWPESGPVAPDKWSREPNCESGGLFGWPWGFGIGSGRVPDATARWLVFQAKPEDVVWVDGKAKTRCGEVTHCGTMASAFAVIADGRRNWIVASAASSGDYSPVASSGPDSPVASSGDRSPASATGEKSFAFSKSRAMAGDTGTVIIAWWDETTERWRACVGVVGEAGIEAGVWYVVCYGKLVRDE